MKHLKYLLMAALVAMPLTACDEDDGPIVEPTPTGTITGTVSAEGAGLSGVSVTLVGATSQSATTAANGAYTFTNVPAGSYGVSIDASNHPGVSFSQTSKTTTITTAGQQATVDFSGSYIRTAAITGVVSADGQPLAGVSVAVTGGPGDPKNAVTNAGGEYSVTGLRAGTYTVTISNIPTGVTFTTMTQSVTVATGESKTAHFPGQRPEAPVTASVVIKSVTSGGTLFPVDPDNVTGQIDVTLEIDAGGNQLTSIELYLDDVLVGSQTLGHGVVDQGLEMATFSPIFSVNTARFDAATGAVTFLNGSYVLSAKLGLVGAEKPSVTTSMNLVFNNADRFVVTMTNAGATANTAADALGQIWKRGDVTITALPVMYSGRTVSSVNLSLHLDEPGLALVPGVTQNPALVTSGPPFTSTWLNSTSAARRTGAIEPGAIIGVVSASVLSDGSNGPTSIPVGPGNSTAPFFMRLDNAPPVAGTFVLREQDTATRVLCCSNNWAGDDYLFSAGKALQADAGVGLPAIDAVTYHVGAATLTPAAVMALDPVAGARDLAETTTNNAYRAIAVVRDRLGNTSNVSLQPSATGVNPGTLLGVDLTPPTHAFDAASVVNQAIFNMVTGVPAANWVTAYSDASDSPTAAPSGFGVDPVLARIDRWYPDVTGTSRCLLGSWLSPNCRYIGTTGTSAVPILQGYLTFEAYATDQGGNVSTPTLSRVVLNDQTPPSASNIAIPSTLTGGAATTFTADVTDNLNLWRADLRLRFGDVDRLPFGMPDVLNDQFPTSLLTTYSYSMTLPFVRSLETTDGGHAPANDMVAASQVSLLIEDAATNYFFRENAFAAGTVAAPALSFGGTPAVLTFLVALPDAAQNVNNGLTGVGAPVCAANTPGTRALTVRATGVTGTFANPFTAVHLYRRDAVVTDAPLPNVLHYIGTASAPSVTDDGTTRVWSYSAAFNATGIPAEAGVEIIAVGVNAAGYAIRTNTNLNLSICNQS